MLRGMCSYESIASSVNNNLTSHLPCPTIDLTDDGAVSEKSLQNLKNVDSIIFLYQIFHAQDLSNLPNKTVVDTNLETIKI